ncbi:hypothetical protein D3C87_1435100 [compost metagenome]
MVQHIYGKTDLLVTVNRPNLFINELNLYIDYLKKDISTQINELSAKKAKYFAKFKAQLEQGITYYKQLLPVLKQQTSIPVTELYKQLQQAEQKLDTCKI